MNTELLTILVGGAVTVITAVVTALLTRRKYTTETRRTELDNVRQGNDILMQQIVEPLKNELKSLRNDLKRFRKAIEKIPGCSLADECPVSRELFNAEKDDGYRSADVK